MQNIEVVAAALINVGGEVLVAQRPPGKVLAGRWEFPGGKIAAGESQDTALRRELAEELGVVLREHRHMLSVVHDYADRRVTLHFYLAESFSGDPRGLDNQALRWIAIDRLGEVDILEADRPFVEALQARQQAAPATAG